MTGTLVADIKFWYYTAAHTWFCLWPVMN